MDYDVAIIGGGIGGLFAAYRLKQYDKDLSIVIIEKGRELEERVCPAAAGKACAHCSICAITSGVAGAGAFSDAKFNLGTAYGGTLGEEIGERKAMNYINKVDNILQGLSNNYPQIYESNAELSKLCLQNGLQLLDMNVRHLGTDRNVETMSRLIKRLRYYGVHFLTRKSASHIVKDENGLYTIFFQQGDYIEAEKVIIATGRSGADFVQRVCKDFDIATEANAVDIGVRVEMKDAVWADFSDRIYEPKILYKTKTFEDNCRMFCFNKGGIVSAENNHGIITANGHAYADPAKKTDNCNFAILSSINFTEPFNQPTEYAENISRMANMIGDGNVLVQRFGDLVRGRRTTDARLARNTVRPTLKATAGDISLVLPHRILTNIIETIYALNEVAPGTANDDTLLYGCESKYYSLKPKHNENFEIYPGIYLIGDGSGITRGLSQSAAMGLYVAEKIVTESSHEKSE